jgi:hypothetical protein
VAVALGVDGAAESLRVEGGHSTPMSVRGTMIRAIGPGDRAAVPRRYVASGMSGRNDETSEKLIAGIVTTEGSLRASTTHMLGPPVR